MVFRAVFSCRFQPLGFVYSVITKTLLIKSRLRSVYFYVRAQVGACPNDISTH